MKELNEKELKAIDGGNPIFRKFVEWAMQAAAWDAVKEAANGWCQACEGPHSMTNQYSGSYMMGPH